ncbi:MAG: iron-sulfur cluster assembly scaffold protein [Clostridia bacterium]|nr:iron-sulfur cluster assembly scaffold protein [Clostridia bacterium]
MFSTRVLDIFKNPMSAGGLQGANGVGKYIDPVCGDQVKIYLKIEKNIVTEARFKAVGSVATIVFASSICTCVLDCTIEECLNLNAQRLFEIT